VKFFASDSPLQTEDAPKTEMVIQVIFRTRLLMLL